MKIIKVTVCIGLFIVASMFRPTELAAQQQGQQSTYKEQLILVEAKLRSGDFNGALASLDEALVKYPDVADVHYAKALLFGQARNFAVAIPVAERAVELAPDNLVYSNYLVGLYKMNNELPKAIQTVDALLKIYPENEAIYREKMMLLYGSKRSEEALAVYELAAGKFGVSDTLAIVKGEILVDMGRLPEAEKLLQPWVDKGSKLRQVYSTLGYISLENKNPKSAIQVIEKGIAHTNDNLLYLDLADAYASTKKNKLAFEALKKAFDATDVEFSDKYRVMFTALSGKTDLDITQIHELANILVIRHPRVADSHVAKGEVLWRRGNLEEARAMFLTAVSMNRGHVEAWRMLINVELALNKLDDALAHSFESLDANPNNAMLMYFTSMTYMVKEDYENARKMLEKALDSSVDDTPYLQSLIYAGLGDLYHKLKMDDVSDVAYEEAIKLDSTNAVAMNNYAYYLSERNHNLELAAELSKTANELEPNSSTYQDTYAWVLFKQAAYKDALKWIEKAIAGPQPSALLFEHYGDILIKNGNAKEAVKQWSKALAQSTGNDLNIDKLKSKIAKKSYVE